MLGGGTRPLDEISSRFDWVTGLIWYNATQVKTRYNVLNYFPKYRKTEIRVKARNYQAESFVCS